MAKAIFDGIEIGTDDDVDLRGTAITSLPDNLTVGGKVYGLELDVTPLSPFAHVRRT